MSSSSELAEQPPASAPRSAEDVLAELRAEPTNPHLLRGFGPLVALAALVLLMVLLVPTVARERIVEQPVDATTTSTTTTTAGAP